MEESKGFKVEISFTDHNLQSISNPDTLTLQATINSNSHLLKFKTPGSISMPSFSPQSVMVLQLCIQNEQIAAAIVQLGRLCGKTLTGDYNKWIRMQSKPQTAYQSDKIKVRIQGSLHAVRKQVTKPKGLLANSPQKKGKCSYLTKLGAVEQAEREIESTLTRVRTRLGTEYDQIFDRGTRSPINRSPTGRKTTRTAGRSPLKASRLDDQAFPQQGMSLELPSRFNLNLEMLSSLEPQLLRNVIVALTEKIQVMKAQVEEFHSIDQVVEAFENPMKELAQSIEETQNQTTMQNGKINEVIQKVEVENTSLEQELAVNLGKIKEIQQQINLTRSECEESKKENDDLKAHALTDIGLNIQNLRQKIAENEKSSKGLHRAYQQALNKFSYSIESVDKERARLVDQKADVLVKLKQIKAELDQSEIQNIQLQGTLSALQATLTSQQDTLSRLSLLTNLNDHFGDSNSSLNSQYGSSNTQFKSLTTQSTNLNKKIQLDLKDLISLKTSTTKEKTNHQQEKQVCEKNLEEFQKRLNDIQKMLDRGKGVYQNYDQLFKEYLGESEILNDVLCQLTYFSDLVFSQAQAGLITQRLSTRLNELLQQKEFQKSSLTRMVDSMQKLKAAYVPREDDKIDKALGQFLNSMQTTPEVNFVRLSRGKYKFGLREVNLSLEGNDIVVQFGTNRVFIDEFVDGYTEIEKEKIDKEVASRKSPSPSGSPSRAFSRSITAISPSRRPTFSKQFSLKK